MRMALHYNLKVRVDPASQKLEAEVWIQQPPSSRFCLHKGLAARRVAADGKLVAFHQNSSSDSLPYTVGSPVLLEVDEPQQLHVEYGGELREAVSGVNMITPKLVELAYYSAWYPIFQGLLVYTFEMETNIPVGFVTTTNGLKRRQWERDSRCITLWTSYKPGSDLVLIASPLLHKLERAVKDMRVEMYYHRLSAELLKTKMDSLVEGMNRLSGFYGPLQVKEVFRFVYSPRGGWGYSRIPLVLVSEDFARQEMTREYGEARDFHGSCHEMAHFWWSVADSSTPDDWINEGLAEFSAFRLSEERFGKAFAETLIDEYRKHANESQTSDSIAETESSSPDRYVSRYEKTTLLFLEAQRRYGREPLDRFFKALYTRFAGTRKATTPRFLEEVGTHMGKDAQAFFCEALYCKNPAS